MRNLRTFLIRYKYVLLLFPSLFLLTVFFLIPMVMLLAMSFFKYDRISLYIIQLTWDNYVKFFSDPYFFGMVYDSLKVGFYTTIFALLIGYPIAYYLARIRGGERTMLSAACLLPIFVTILVTTLGWYIIFLPFGVVQRLFEFLGFIDGPLHWLHSVPALIVVFVHLHMPYVILILAASIQNVSEEKINAAKILGASTPKIIQKVLIPLTMPGIVSSSILVFALAISSYLIPILITGQSLRLLPMAIFSYTTELLNWPFASAIAIILLFIVFIATYGFIALTNRMTNRGKWEVV
ncbi:MAG: ABC transporter permease [Deltaproteobacteria bacterium]|nr:ABC transporter permease [Deltaproteobacteria bacterium]